MKNLQNKAILFFKIIIPTLFLLAFAKILFVTDNFSDSVVISFIGALAASITILSSFLIAKQTSVSNAKLQRDMEARKIKQEFYHTFLEVLSVKFSYMKNMDSDTAIEANKKFCIEVNRLPLFASQEVVEWVNNLAAGGTQADFKEFYELVRKDLCSDIYKDFDNLNKIHFQIPNKI